MEPLFENLRQIRLALFGEHQVPILFKQIKIIQLSQFKCPHYTIKLSSHHLS